MIDNHFIKHIKIENFRCFENLKIEGLNRVNLLGGDNSVGKSAFLEILEIAAKTDNSWSLILAIKDIINRRQRSDAYYNSQPNEFDIITYGNDSVSVIANNISINLVIKHTGQLAFFGSISGDQSISELQGNYIDENLFVELTINNNTEKIPYNKFSDILSNKRETSFTLRNIQMKLIENIEFIPSTRLDERKLSTLYGTIVDMGMMRDIDAFLTTFDVRIEALIIRPTERYSVFKLKLRDKNEPVLLSSMGGGLNRYLAIVCAIWKSKNGQLFIDEVENGIHYTKYSKLWEIIFKTSKEANCQIFAATHSKECIEAFSRVAEEYDNENIKYINFSRDADNAGRIIATVLDSIGIENNFQLGFDVR